MHPSLSMKRISRSAIPQYEASQLLTYTILHPPAPHIQSVRTSHPSIRAEYTEIAKRQPRTKARTRNNIQIITSIRHRTTRESRRRTQHTLITTKEQHTERKMIGRERVGLTILTIEYVVVSNTLRLYFLPWYTTPITRG